MTVLRSTGILAVKVSHLESADLRMKHDGRMNGPAAGVGSLNGYVSGALRGADPISYFMAIFAHSVGTLVDF